MLKIKVSRKIAYSVMLILLLSLVVSIVSADKAGTCANPIGGKYCGQKSAVSNCYCDKACTNAQDCCTDYKELCLGGQPISIEKSFRYASWQCYDGYSEKQGSPTSCKDSLDWKSYADESCKGKCNPDISKCGVNSFGVDTECTIIKPVCGNNICEEGEADYSYCPPCVYNEVNPCKAPCEFKPGTCQQDCQQITTQCTDSDGGKNEFIAGKTYINQQTFIYYDTCFSSTGIGDGVTEYYCSNGKVGKEQIICPALCIGDVCGTGVCTNGACAKPSSPPPNPVITKKDVLNWINSNCYDYVDEVYTSVQVEEQPKVKPSVGYSTK